MQLMIERVVSTACVIVCSDQAFVEIIFERNFMTLKSNWKSIWYKLVYVNHAV